jgi:hypothetical protein
MASARLAARAHGMSAVSLPTPALAARPSPAAMIGSELVPKRFIYFIIRFFKNNFERTALVFSIFNS